VVVADDVQGDGDEASEDDLMRGDGECTMVNCDSVMRAAYVCMCFPSVLTFHPVLNVCLVDPVSS
jgi:hypothetical protein